MPPHHGGRGCLYRIFKIFGTRGKNDANKVHEGSSQKKQHPKGFIGSADDIIYNTKPGVKAFLVVYRMNVFFL